MNSKSSTNRRNAMSSISQVSDALKRVLTTHAKKLERETEFVQRSTAKLDGPTFSQTIVFGWMDTPEASYPQLRHVAASLGVAVSTQAVEQRFGTESAALLRELLQEAVGEVLYSEASAPELLRRFNGVYVQDGTIISLPPELGDEWRGCGGSTPEAGQSSMQVQVRLDLAQGGMQGPWLQEGRAAERSGEAHEAPLPEGCLYNVDAGYFTLAEMRAHGNAGCYWLTAANAGTLLIDERGQCWDLVSFLGAQTGDEVDVQVCLGKRERLPVRLIARRVSAEQAARRRATARRTLESKAKGVQRPNVRTHGRANAKLLGCLITHWLTLIECWQAPNRSMVKARHVMQWMAPLLALGVAGVVPLEDMVQRTSHTMASGCTVNARQKRPAAYQLVAHPKLIRGLG